MLCLRFTIFIQLNNTVVDPGFPVGGANLVEGRQPPIRVLFGKNKRIVSNIIDKNDERDYTITVMAYQT